MNPSHPEQPELDPTDPPLDALLDQALAPDHAPTGLNDRVLAATTDKLLGFRSAGAPAVAGRIHGGFPWRRLATTAAVLTLAVLIGRAYWIDSGIDRNGLLVMDERTETQRTPLFPAVDDGLDQLADAAWETAAIDDDIALLSMQVSAAGSPDLWAQDGFDALDTAIAFETFDEVADELDLYF